MMNGDAGIIIDKSFICLVPPGSICLQQERGRDETCPQSPAIIDVTWLRP